MYEQRWWRHQNLFIGWFSQWKINEIGDKWNKRKWKWHKWRRIGNHLQSTFAYAYTLTFTTLNCSRATDREPLSFRNHYWCSNNLCVTLCAFFSSMLTQNRCLIHFYCVHFIIFHVSSIIDPLTTLFTNDSNIQALRFGHAAYRHVWQYFSSALVVIVKVFFVYVSFRCFFFSIPCFAWKKCLTSVARYRYANTNFWMIPFVGESLIAQTRRIYRSVRTKRLNHVIDQMIIFVKSVCGLHFNCSLLASIGTVNGSITFKTLCILAKQAKRKREKKVDKD